MVILTVSTAHCSPHKMESEAPHLPISWFHIHMRNSGPVERGGGDTKEITNTQFEVGLRVA
jgi:hypothetical protein